MAGPTLGTAVPSGQEGTSQAVGLARSSAQVQSWVQSRKTLMEIQPATPGALSPSSCHQVELAPRVQEILAEGFCLLQCRVSVSSSGKARGYPSDVWFCQPGAAGATPHSGVQSCSSLFPVYSQMT